MLKRVVVYCLAVVLIFTAQNTYASYAVVNSENGDLLIGELAHEALPVASLTKIWTAYIVVKNSNLQDLVDISKTAALMEGSSIYLQEGQQKSVEYLLYGLLLRSGNDAATALAEHVGGSVEGFVILMNDEAQRVGLNNTHFMNPSGLHHDEHMISAYDMAQMLNVAMQDPTFRKIASSTFYSDGTVHWKNKHRLVGQKNALAGKTGFTKVAGRTLATYYQYGDRAFSVVTLGVGDDWNMHNGFAQQIKDNFKVQQIVAKGRYQVAGETIVLQEPIEVLIEEDVQLKHAIKYSRLRKDEALWHVLKDNETIAVRRVKIE